jgi:lia operon protein LiaG
MISRSDLRAASLLALLLLVFVSPAARADYEETFNYPAGSLRLTNLIGAIEVEGHGGSGFVVEVTVTGADAEEGIIEFDSQEGDRSELVIGFPVDDERTYVYPELGRNSRTTFNPGRDDHGIWDVFGRGKIEVRGSGRGMELWADVKILVPAGSELIVFNGVGAMEATDLQAHVEILDLRGERASVDTGSGHVVLRDVDVPRIALDTGSGHVEAERVSCDEIEVDTGSGHVELDELTAASVAVDTGRGRVRVELVEMGDGEFEIDTGSGSITFLLPQNASARIDAETNSGGIDVDVAGADVDRRNRDHVRFEVGDGAARVKLDAGSGGIRIASR